MSTRLTRAGKASALTHNEMDTNLKKASQTKAAAYTIAESDNWDTIEYSGTGAEAFTLPDAATVVAAADTGDFEVTVKHVGTGTLTVDRTTGADTIDGTAADITLETNESKTLKVNQAGDGYISVAYSHGGTIVADVTGDLTGNADTVTTNANLTGNVTSIGNATALAADVVAASEMNFTLTQYAGFAVVPGAYWTPVAGIWNYLFTVGGMSKEIKDIGSVWRRQISSSNDGMVLTDGTNIRFYNGTGVSITVYTASLS